MASRTRVTLNHAEIQSYLDGDHGVREFLLGRAEAVLSAAQADPHDDTGAYEASLHIREEKHPTRLAVQVVADVSYAMLQEARYGVLSRALDAGR